MTHEDSNSLPQVILWVKKVAGATTMLYIFSGVKVISEYVKGEEYTKWWVGFRRRIS